MNQLYKFFILVAISNVVLTFIMIAEMFIFRIPPSLWIAGLTIFNWVGMVMTNPFWKDVWKNK